ncbi:MAG: hypothetical protein AAFQ98_25215 [Bacteroidota bacterium]
MEKDLRRLQAELESHLGWGEAGAWHSSMFAELSEHIQDKTGTPLSVTTLKRFFGVVNYKGVPSVTTLDTLSQFAGYQNWREFRMATPAKAPSRTLRVGRGVYVTVGFVFALFVMVLLANRYPVATPSLDPSAVNFTSRVLTHTYPNSVVFDFDLGGFQSDNMRIQQYWDETRTIALSPEQSQATGIYYYPGYFEAQLIVNEKSISTHDLFLKSQGWLGLINYDPVPGYFTPQQGEDGALFLPDEVEEEVHHREDPTWVEYHLIDDYGPVAGDNFTLRATLQNTFRERWAVCQQARIYVIGTDGAMIIPVAKLGCSSDMGLMLNDRYWNGKEHDLSALAADLSTPTAIELRVENQLARVSINGEQVFSSQ